MAKPPGPGMSPMPAPWLQRMSLQEQQFKLPPNLIAAMTSQESSGGVNVGPSSAGALGILQFMPETAKAYGVNRGDPISEIDGAARYMSDLIRQNGGDVSKALEQYSDGTPGYAQEVLARLGQVPPVKAEAPPPTAPPAPQAQGSFRRAPAQAPEPILFNPQTWGSKWGGHQSGAGQQAAPPTAGPTAGPLLPPAQLSPRLQPALESLVSHAKANPGLNWHGEIDSSSLSPEEKTQLKGAVQAALGR